MPSVITDPQAYAKAIMERRRLLQMVQSGAAQVAGGSGTYIPKLQQEPSSQLDPAQASANGFNIPDYISPAQTAGGSGDYMSKVMNQAPNAQVAGSSGDYMSKVSQSPDSSVPPQDDSIFSFFGKPEATDAMAAFGAGMLRGKNFADGLANATEGVNNVAKQYRGLSPREIALLEQKAEIQRRLNPSAIQKGDIWYSPDDRPYREVFNPSSPNGSSFLDITSGKIVNTLPTGSKQRVDSPVGERSTANAKLETEARDAALKASSDLNIYDSMLELLPTSGAGPDAISNAKRAFVNTTGIDLTGVNLSDMQTVNSLVRQIELNIAQSQKGLGQLTEMERRIIRESLPTLDSDQTAFRRMIEMLRNRAEKSQRLYEDWMTIPSDVKSSQYNGSFENFAYFWRKQNSGSKSAQPEAKSSQTGNKPSLDDIFK